MDACELSEFSSLPASGLQAHRKARRLISLQALDRVVQIGPPTQEIFRPPGQRERERQCPRCCSGGSDTLRRMAELEDRRVRIAARILNRTADQSRFRREPDGFGHNFRRVAKALFQVRRDGQKGATSLDVWEVMDRDWFQSTPPREGATHNTANAGSAAYVSIHAPAR